MRKSFCLSMALMVLVIDASEVLIAKKLDQELLTVFDETTTVNVPALKGAKAEISYLFADLRFRGNQIKICELGEGRNAGGAHSEVIHGGKVFKMPSPYWKLFWHYLGQFKMPVWYVGHDPLTHHKEGRTMQLKEKLFWDDFLAIGGRSVSSLEELEKDAAFLALQKRKKSAVPDDISTYKGIIVYHYRDDRYEHFAQPLKAFKEKYSDFLFLDEASQIYAANKLSFGSLCNDRQLAQYRPCYGVYKKAYTPNLARRIKQQIKSPILVIKPIDSGRSNGIIMVPRNKLDRALQRILLGRLKSDQKKALNYRPVYTKNFDYWRNDKNNKFIVESYERSKKLLIREKWYDPTMRVIFVMRLEKGVIHTTILGAYWKIPGASLSDEASLTKKLKTISVKTPGYTGLRIPEADLIKVKGLFHAAFPKIYKKMLLKLHRKMLPK